MLNLIGLGFGFHAKDGGLLKFQKQADAGFGRMGTTLESLNSIASAFTSSGMELTTQLEAFRTHSDTTARRVLANAGFMGKGFDKMSQQATSMAEGLNLSADATARAIAAAKDAAPAMKALGLEAQDLAKFEAVTGASAQDVADGFSRLQSEFQIKDIKAFETALVQSGSATRDIGGQVGFLQDSLRLLSRTYALGEEDIAKYGIDILRASAGFRAFTRSTEEARSLAKNLTEALIQNREGFDGLLSGVQDDLPRFTSEFGIMAQDVTVAFNNMRKGPAEFVAEWVRLGSKAQDSGFLNEDNIKFLRSRLEQATDPQMAGVLINIMKQGGTAADKFLHAMDEMPKSIKEVNKAFRTGRTLDDQMQLMEEQMIASFRSISKGGKNLVETVRPEFKAFGDDLKKMAADDGPMGAVVRKMSEIHQIGAMALVPDALKPMVASFSTLTKRITPALSGIQSTIGEMTNLGGFVKTAALGLGFLTFQLERNRAKLGDHDKAVDATAHQLADFVKGALDQAKSWVKKAPGLFKDLGRIYGEINKVLKDAWKEIEPTLTPLIVKAKAYLMDKLEDVGVWLADAIQRVMTKVLAMAVTALETNETFAPLITMARKLGLLGEKTTAYDSPSFRAGLAALPLPAKPVQSQVRALSTTTGGVSRNLEEKLEEGVDLLQSVVEKLDPLQSIEENTDALNKNRGRAGGLLPIATTGTPGSTKVGELFSQGR